MLNPLDVNAKGFSSTSDFYKRLALECTSQQVCVDLFALNTEYIDLGTLSEFYFYFNLCQKFRRDFKVQQRHDLSLLQFPHESRAFGSDAIQSIVQPIFDSQDWFRSCSTYPLLKRYGK